LPIGQQQNELDMSLMIYPENSQNIGNYSAVHKARALQG
jgi:hypothetical protein